MNIKNLLKNNVLDLEAQVAEERLKLAGVVLGKDLNLPKRPVKYRFPKKLIRRLAGG